MRILQVRFANLNSLQGEWCIDFTHPAYASTSIFAITGPTGSGKTTLLDAICLALYGRTPRLKTISKSSNELLTRQQGQCHAEVVFTTVKGSYRCFWSQHRARKSPQGDLQQPRHEIALAESGELLENRIKNVAAKVEEVTGMNFDQFTRSILLAQGSFAAFLLASPDQRSPLLEQITGTSIYSTISQKVHERTASHERDYARRKEELGALELLPEEEWRAMQQHLKDNTAAVQTLATAVAEIQRQLNWHDTAEALQKEVTVLEEDMDRLLQAEEEEAPTIDLLARARSAAALLPDHQELIRFNSMQLQERLEQRELKAEALNRQIRIAALEQQTSSGRNLLEKTEKRAEGERKVATTVRALDVKIEDEKQHLERERREQEKLQQQESRLSARLKEQRRRRDETSAAYHRLQEYCRDHEGDSVLAEKYTGIEERIDALITLIAKEKQITARRKENTRRLHDLEKEERDIRRAHEEALENHRTAAGKHQKLLEAIAALQTDYPRLGQQQQDISDSLRTLDKIDGLLLRAKTCAEEKKRSLEKGEELRATLQTAEQLIADLAQRRAAQEKIVGQQEEIVLLASRVKNFEQERTLLQDGSPCPLCGALDHPFAKGMIDDDETLVKTLAVEKKKLAEMDGRIAQQTAKLSAARAELEECRKRLNQAVEQHQQCLKDMVPLCGAVGLDASSLTDERLEAQRRQLDDRREELIRVAAQLETHQLEEARLRRLSEGLLQKQHDLERRLSEAVHSVGNLRRRAEDLAEESGLLSEDIGRRQEKLSQEIAPFGLSSTLSAETLQAIRATLAARLQKWKETVATKERLAAERLSVEKEYDKELILATRLQEELRQRNDLLDGRALRLEQLRNERCRIYADKDPEREEAALALAVTTAKHRLQEVESSLAEETKADLVAQDRLQRLEQSLAEREKLLQRRNEDFAGKLHDRHFANADAFGAALLPAARIEELSSSLERLQSEKTRTATLLAEKRGALSRHDENGKNIRERMSLQEELETAQEQLQALHQESGRLQGKLEENDMRMLQHRSRREDLAAYKKDLQRWRRLDELIGSANGKKFRNFAQGITFENMVAQANRSLRTMTDRYLLVRDESHPLELNVIDNYRGGDIRTTQNLSGGESFLVSLALALGLSKMAGKNVRVDSLFLDEGFGTLDEETLDTALQTLAGLQQEGKTIGIISHVSLLKERLDTQIRVIPERGGRSILRGPGVASLSRG